MSDEIDNMNRLQPWVAPTLRRAAEMLMAQGREVEGADDPYAGLLYTDDAEFLRKLASAFEAGAIVPAQRLRDVEHDLEQYMAIAQSETERAERLEAHKFRYVNVTAPSDFIGYINLFWGEQVLALVPPPASDEIRRYIERQPAKGDTDE